MVSIGGMIKILMAIMVLMVFSINIHISHIEAQRLTTNDLLIYTQKTDSETVFILRYADKVTSYSVSNSLCASLSLSGKYLYIYEPLGNSIQVVYLASQEVIVSQSWLGKTFFNFCSDFHMDDNRFYILKSAPTETSPSIYYEFQFTGTSLIEHPDYQSTFEPIEHPSLPNYLPDIKQNFLAQSPTHPHIYIYEKCLTGTSTDGIYCDDRNTEIVIYNSLTENELEVLLNAIPDAFRGYVINPYEPDYKQYIGGAKRFSWSLSGRYIVYSLGIDELTQNTMLRVYDLQDDVYLDTSQTIYSLSSYHEFQWSESNILTIWVDYGMGYDGQSTNTQPITATFYHANTEAYVVADNFYESLESLWSPDGTQFALVGREFIYPDGYDDQHPYQLIIFDPYTRASTFIDDIENLLLWRSICDFTPLDSASLISTIQAEPYGVICLAENGQYNLTARLPDVIGDITIIGNGATITMTGEGRVFNVTETGDLTLEDVIVLDGA